MGEMMKKKNLISSGLALVSIFSLTLYSQTGHANDEFQQWMQQQSSDVAVQKTEFQEYKDKRDKEFTSFLKAQWKAVDIVKGEVRDEVPKPIIMPMASLQPVVVAPAAKPVTVTIPEPVFTKPVVVPVVVAPKGSPVDIDFYGRELTFYYDDHLKHRLNSPINKEAVSNYWSILSRADYEDLLKQLQLQKKLLQLNDWAYASLISKITLKIDDNHRNESALLSWFLLAKSGYRARIAYNSAAIYLLIPSEQEMFEVTYFTFNGKRYYAAEFEGGKQAPGKVFTYDGEYPETTKDFDMRINAVEASSNQDARRHLSFEFEGNKYNIEVSYDRGRIKFLNTYPQLSLNFYFGSDVYKATATPLQQQLAASMKGMSEQQAVNFLLRFVQTSLKYETDGRQFGEENYLFPEETLFYPYSDCEDRAVLFAWLVHSLLNLQVVGLDFPGHVAAAVHFNEPVKGDSISHHGKRYVVTDPTYINANAGMTMPDYKQYKPVVISY
ncbi:MAG: hypothetical protein RQ982_06710 [Gammaproteobacteria bacterium]|nr:hypothetical protein [Gammaproteobacteria bacterium]